jgi:hypothetical protein
LLVKSGISFQKRYWVHTFMPNDSFGKTKMIKRMISFRIYSICLEKINNVRQTVRLVISVFG